MADASAQQIRIVPGAPPPPPLTKSQLKKKRKTKAKAAESPVEIPDSTAAALVEKAPEVTDIQEGAVAPELVAQPSQSEPQTVEDATLTLSPIVDLVNKRLKVTNKKITRITAYTNADPASLNEDQKRMVSSLPALEAISKELVEVKKAVETHEAELAVELAAKRRAAEEVERKRVSQAVSAAEALNHSKVANLLSFQRMRALYAAGELDLYGLGVSQEEVDGVHAAGAILLGDDGAAKDAVIHGFMSIDGQFEGISYSRFLEITERVFAPPPPVETPVANADEPLHEVVSDEPDEPEVAPPTGVPMTASGSFHFMMESELETPSFEESAEWVDAADAVEESEQIPKVNGHVEETPAHEAAPSNEPLDWAAEDEDELPPIDNLHATFGKSGSATPTVQPELVQDAAVVEPTTNGKFAQPVSAVEEDDGFTQARGGRGRGGRGSRGGDRGFRGGYRGNGPRGGDRGRGGGFRGRGEWRGGDGEVRGRGRGRGRGGFAPPS